MLKRYAALIMALLIMICAGAQAAGGESTQGHPAVGGWQLTEYEFDGEKYTAEDIADMDERIELRADGSAQHMLYGETEEGSWQLSGETIELHTPTVEYTLMLKDGRLIMDGEDTKARFERSADMSLSYDGAQAMAMSNAVNGGLFAIDGGELFGLGWNGQGSAMLSVRALTDGETVMGEARALDEGCLARALSFDGDRLYYIREGVSGESGIFAVNMDGSKREMLLEGEFRAMQLYGGRLYCCDSAGKLSSMALDGSDAQAILDGVAQFYMLNDEWLVYTDAEQGLLRMHGIADGQDVQVSERRAALPVLRDSYLYFYEYQYAPDDERAGSAVICRMDMATQQVERASVFSSACMAFNSAHVFAADGYKLGDLEAWWTLGNVGDAAPGVRPVYATDEYLVSLVYESGMAVRVEVERLSDRAASSANA